jgi:hypothetical protein
VVGCAAILAFLLQLREHFMSANWFETCGRDLLIVAGLFAASRLLYLLLGVEFDASTVPTYMQFIDTQLLTTRLLESLWYYHANPPLLNLLAGLGYKIFGSQAGAFFSVVFHLLGLATACSVYLLTLKLSASRLAAHLATGLLMFSPAFVLYENWMMYSFPAAALLTISAWALYRYVETRRTRWCVAFFGLLAVLLLVRSLFHLAWMVLVATLLAACLRGHARQVLSAAAIPVLIVALWYGKNYYYFGTFSSSTWLGLGLSNISTLLVTREELQPLVNDGRLTPFALVSRYRERDKLFTSQQLPPTGVPVLDQVRKSNGTYNFNSQQLIAINRMYAHDGITIIRTYPFSYIVGLVISNRLFFSPTSMNLYFSPGNRRAAHVMEKIYNPLLLGVSGAPSLMRQPHFGFRDSKFLEVNTSIPLIATWILVLGYGYLQVRRGVMNPDLESQPRVIAVAFIALTAVYVYVVGTALELAENYRYRFLIEPLFMVLAATAATSLVRRVRNMVAAKRAGDSAASG